MKNICKNTFIFLIILMLSSCKSDEKPDDNLNLRFEVLEDSMRYIPTNIGIESTWDYGFYAATCNPYGMFKLLKDDTCRRNPNHLKLAKIRITNEGETISLFMFSRYYLPTQSWTRKGIRKDDAIHCFSGARGDDRIIFLKKNDTTTVYWGYGSEIQANTDTFGFHLSWKRDSLGSDYVKYYLDNQKKLKYHSIVKSSRNFYPGHHYKYQKYSTIMKKLVEDTLIRKETEEFPRDYYSWGN